MGIFNLFTNKEQSSPEIPAQPKDERKAECPYCHQILPKIPGKKTKCPNCGETMFVRTRPKDNVRAVVTKAEADKIDEEWTIVSGTHDTYLADKEAFNKEKESLKLRFGGREPSEQDVKWSLYNKDLIEHMKQGDWGLYRNTKFEMAEMLTRELKFKQALQMYFEVCFIDLNGARNMGGITDPEILKEFPPFDPKQAFLAPGLVDIIQRIAKKLSLGKDELRTLFIEHNSKIDKGLRMPISADECWIRLEKKL